MTYRRQAQVLCAHCGKRFSYTAPAPTFRCTYCKKRTGTCETCGAHTMKLNLEPIDFQTLIDYHEEQMLLSAQDDIMGVTLWGRAYWSAAMKNWLETV